MIKMYRLSVTIGGVTKVMFTRKPNVFAKTVVDINIECNMTAEHYWKDKVFYYNMREDKWN